MRSLPIAAQVYSVRQEAEADFAGVMAQLKAMGYDGVELAGLYGKSVGEIKDCLEKNGLIAISAHVPYEEPKSDLEGTVKTYQEIGCKFLAVPWLPEERRFGGSRYQETLDFIPEIAKVCRAHDIRLLYHNHDFEFKKTEDGTYHLDLLYAAISSEDLSTELDTCWVKVGGAEPETYLEKYQNRCPLVHMKDFIRKEQVELVALGEGEQNMEALTASAVKNGAQWLIVEQDHHPYGTPMGNMKKSIDCLKNILA